MSIDNIDGVKKNIASIFDKRKIAILALAFQYAGYADKYFNDNQARNEYWNNQSYDAKNRMFTDAKIEGNIIFWRMGHGVEYGPYLELANNGRNQAIRPIIQKYAGRFFRDVKELYAD